MNNAFKLLCAAAAIELLAGCNSRAPAGRIEADDALSVDENGYLRTRKGRDVVLRGVNFGGWMIQESWMCPVFGTDRAWANLDTIMAMESRGWTAADIQELFDIYQDNWITANDFDFLKAQGVNSIRIPFWYRNFMSGENGAWIGDDGSGIDTTNPGFRRLDWAVAQAGERGMYVIFDLHGAPGGQSMDHCSGTIGRNELYTNAAYEQITVDLWKAIAARYKDEAAVAAYDLLNEPQNNGGYTGTNAWAPDSARAVHETVRIYDRLYREIRSVDMDTIIVMEGIWSMNLPDPMYVYNGPLNTEEKYSGKTTAWDKNIMYSMHLYDNSLSMINSRINELTNARKNWGVAVHIGEFKNDNEGNQNYAYDRYNANKINWNMWTYKIAGANMGSWPLYQAPRKPKADPHTDSLDEIKQKWGETLRTFNPGTNIPANGFNRTGMYDLFKAGLN
ncbi:MAG: glycoside hydrolase family 5 protein [Treponema sp.]|jgi:aryl-phospho-beta-D-glucosidase BglC (GH1 family)|nr:glycoside hydrolase family 5 protein [Treponema sp.]